MANKDKVNIDLSDEVNHFVEKLLELKLLDKKSDAFRLGVALSLSMDPDKEIKKGTGRNNIADASSLDQGGQISFLIKELSKKDYSEEIYRRMEALGNWGLKAIKEDFWDGESILWNKIEKEIK